MPNIKIMGDKSDLSKPKHVPSGDDLRAKRERFQGGSKNKLALDKSFRQMSTQKR